MATVKTVLVKGRSNRSGKFPLVVQVLHKRRKKVVYTGFSIPDTLFDPVKGRVIDGGENTPESIRRINHRCESISRVLLKCISMIEKKSREYEIEDVFRTYGVLTHEAGFYFYFSRKIRELRESGHEETARVYASSLRSMQRYLGKKNFPFIKLSSRIISDYQGKLLASIEAYEEIVAYARKKQAETGSKLLWGTANVFGHARYMNGAATNPDFDVVARAAVQIKNALDATIALGGENYVFWGGREGYMSLLNTDQKREKNHLALLLAKARDYARSQGFKGTFLIEPKPMEPMKHQYDADTETVIGFLKAHGLDKDFKVNIEVNHATLAGHTFEHELACAVDAGMLGSIDANRGDYQNGWDTDQFPIDNFELVQAMIQIIRNGGLGTGGTNFDAKTRRNSTDLEDIFIAHIAGMDAFARALENADRLLRESPLCNMLKARYASFDTGAGKAFEEGKLSLEDLREYAIAHGEPKQTSGKQELYEAMINMYI